MQPDEKVVGDPHGRMLVSEAEWGEIVEKGETVMPYMGRGLCRNVPETISSISS